MYFINRCSNALWVTKDPLINRSYEQVCTFARGSRQVSIDAWTSFHGLIYKIVWTKLDRSIDEVQFNFDQREPRIRDKITQLFSITYSTILDKTHWIQRKDSTVWTIDLKNIFRETKLRSFGILPSVTTNTEQGKSNYSSSHQGTHCFPQANN